MNSLTFYDQYYFYTRLFVLLPIVVSVIWRIYFPAVPPLNSECFIFLRISELVLHIKLLWLDKVVWFTGTLLIFSNVLLWLLIRVLFQNASCAPIHHPVMQHRPTMKTNVSPCLQVDCRSRGWRGDASTLGDSCERLKRIVIN